MPIGGAGGGASGSAFPSTAPDLIRGPAAAPATEVFHPADPRRNRPHRRRDLAMLGLALVVFAAVARQVLG